jgi:hypothetical protein
METLTTDSWKCLLTFWIKIISLSICYMKM